MANKVTLQQIADTLHISRNSVSKAINGQSGISPKMRKAILDTATSLGYSKIYAGENPSEPNTSTLIHVISKENSNSHFWGEVIKGIEAVASKASLHVIVDIAKPDASGILCPPDIDWAGCLGVILIEIYDQCFVEKILDHTGVLVSIDVSPKQFMRPLRMDVLMTRSAQSYREIIERILSQGRRSIAFIGDINDSLGFHERWTELGEALAAADIPLDPRLCLTYDQSSNLDYRNFEWLRGQISAFPYFPDAILCGNDIIAMTVLKVVKSLGKRCPEDVMIAGFDGLPECEFVEPPITTAIAPREELGNRAVEMLLDRRKKPDRTHSVVYLDSIVKLRSSTGLTDL